jgi:hypothetical protein
MFANGCAFRRMRPGSSRRKSGEVPARNLATTSGHGEKPPASAGGSLPAPHLDDDAPDSPLRVGAEREPPTN